MHCTSEDWFINRGQVYAGPLANGDVAVVIINWGDKDIENFVFSLSEVGVSGTVIARDLWKHEDIGEYEGTFKVGKLAPFSSLSLRLRTKQGNGNYV